MLSLLTPRTSSPLQIALSKEYKSKEASLNRAGTYKCIQQTGEAIIVPRGWGHAVVNHGDTFAIAVEKVGQGRSPTLPASPPLNERTHHHRYHHYT